MFDKYMDAQRKAGLVPFDNAQNRLTGIYQLITQNSGTRNRHYSFISPMYPEASMHLRPPSKPTIDSLQKLQLDPSQMHRFI